MEYKPSETKPLVTVMICRPLRFPAVLKVLLTIYLKVITKITTIYYDGTESDWLKLSNGNSALEHLTVYYASNVSFNLNGHGETTPETQKVYTSKTATKPADPKSNGYIFTGWYTDKECTNPFDFNTAITKDITLYAGWEAIPDHELTVKVGTFTYDDNAASDKGNVYEGALVTVTSTKTTSCGRTAA